MLPAPARPARFLGPERQLELIEGGALALAHALAGHVDQPADLGQGDAATIRHVQGARLRELPNLEIRMGDESRAMLAGRIRP